MLYQQNRSVAIEHIWFKASKNDIGFLKLLNVDQRNWSAMATYTRFFELTRVEWLLSFRGEVSKSDVLKNLEQDDVFAKTSRVHAAFPKEKELKWFFCMLFEQIKKTFSKELHQPFHYVQLLGLGAVIVETKMCFESVVYWWIVASFYGGGFFLVTLAFSINGDLESFKILVVSNKVFTVGEYVKDKAQHSSNLPRAIILAVASAIDFPCVLSLISLKSLMRFVKG